MQRGRVMQTRGGHLGTRQACSLILLTAALVGSCVALAMRTLLESGSGMLMVLLIMGVFMSIMSVTVTLTRRHIRQRREAGYQTACFQCIQLAPMEPSAPVRPASRSSAHMAPSHREQLELSVRSALSALPEHVVSSDREEDCALCMEPMLKDERVRQLPSCGHTYHTKCAPAASSDLHVYGRATCLHRPSVVVPPPQRATTCTDRCASRAAQVHRPLAVRRPGTPATALPALQRRPS